MPRFIVSSKSKTGGCCDDNSVDRNSSIFFYNLANKLLDLSKTIEAKINDLKNTGGVNRELGILVSISTPSMVLGLKFEYAVYLERYGPPPDGQWDENRLALIRLQYPQYINYNQ
jgi:hypothetical protein